MATRPCANPSPMRCIVPHRCPRRAMRALSSAGWSSFSSLRSDVEMTFQRALARPTRLSPARALAWFFVAGGFARNERPRAAAPRHHPGRARRGAHRGRAVRRPGRRRPERRRCRHRGRPATERALQAARTARPGCATDARRAGPLRGLAPAQVRFPRHRPCRARRERARRRVRTLQRADWPAVAHEAPGHQRAGPARDGAPDRRPDLRAAHGHSRRILDAHRLCRGRWSTAQRSAIG